jgi:hypothetical protein
MATSSGPAPIDPRGPRTNQAVLAAGLLLGLAFGQAWVAPLFAVVLLLGAALGPSYGPVLRLFRDVIRPRLDPPAELEDPRPPRFAASMGVVVLSAATLAFVAGVEVLGWGLVVLVAALAALSAISGLCIGCEMYVLLVRLRGGVRVVKVDRGLGPVTDGRPVGGPERLAAVSASSASASASASESGAEGGGRLAPLPSALLAQEARWVVFSTEYCAVCPSVVAEIEQSRPGERVVVLDVGENLDLAARYKVRRAPTVLRADGDGTVLARLSGVEALRRELVATAAV